MKLPITAVLRRPESRSIIQRHQLAERDLTVSDQTKPTRFWNIVALLWASYYFILLFVGRYPQLMQPVIWIGGPLLSLVTLSGLFRSREKLQTEEALYGCFLLWSITGLALAVNLDGYFYGLRRVFQLFILVTCVGLTLRHSGRMNWFYVALFVTGIFNGFVALKGHNIGQMLSAEQLTRVEGILENPNMLGFTGLVGIFGALGLWGEKIRFKWRICLAGGVAFLIITVLASAARGAFVSMVVALVLWPISCYGAFIRKHPAVIAPVFILMIVVLVGAQFAIQNTYLGRRLQTYTYSIEEQSSQKEKEPRLALAMDAMEVFASNPLAGVGLNQFRYVSRTGHEAHGDYVEVLSTTGLVGAIIYLSLYPICWLRLGRVLKSTRNELTIYRARFLKFLLMMFLLAGFYRSNFNLIDSMYILAMCFGFSTWLERNETGWPEFPRNDLPKRNKTKNPIRMARMRS